MTVRTEGQCPELPTGLVIERCIRWGIPASPLFAAMFQAVAVTPSLLPANRAAQSYLICMAGALIGFLLVALTRTPTRRKQLIWCWTSAILLETAWIVLTIGEFWSLYPCTLTGMVLTGVSTSVLLCLWITLDQQRDLLSEVGKLSAALVFGFLLRSLIDVVPYLYLGFTLPFLTGIPLALRLARAREVNSLDTDSPQTVIPFVWLRANGFALAAIPLFGASVVVVGAEGAVVQYGAVLGACALFVALALGQGEPAVIGHIATPLAVAGMGMGLLFDSGAPYSVLFAGCISYITWLWLSARITPKGTVGPATLQTTAICLLVIDVLTMLGLLFERCISGFGGVDMQSMAIALCILFVTVDFVRRAAALRTKPNASSPHAPISTLAAHCDVDEKTLMQAFGLSAREAQVACLLCENRSVNYVCACLELSRSTVKTHVRHIYEKAGVHSKDELQLLVSDRNRKEGA